MAVYKRDVVGHLLSRLGEKRRFIQVLAGPRQVGKTTAIRQALEILNLQARYVTADTPEIKDMAWIETAWESGRQLAGQKPAVLALDEIQKIPGWADAVKKLWDEDTANSVPLHIVILGSAPLLVQKGLSDSLAGRFELLRVTHWSYPEIRDAFGWDLEAYIYYGGYPGAAGLIGDEARWLAYIQDSLIETTIARDIMLMNRVDKPALLRQLLELSCQYSGQVLSYQKMCGQLQDAGNTTTLAHYLDLLKGAGFVCGIQKYAGQKVRRRASSPKLQVMNNALLSAMHGGSFEESRNSPVMWGRWVESSVGAWLVNQSLASGVALYYWRHRNHEVDFVLEKGDRLTAIEVKSGTRNRNGSGMSAFKKEFPSAKLVLVGGDGVPLKDFMTSVVTDWL